MTAVLVRPLGPVGIARRAAGAGSGVNLAVVGAGFLAVCAFVAESGSARHLPRGRPADGSQAPSVRRRAALDAVRRGVGRHGVHRQRRSGPPLMGGRSGRWSGGRWPSPPSPLPTSIPASATLTDEPSRYGVGWDAVTDGLLGKASARWWMSGRLQTTDRRRQPDVLRVGRTTQMIDGRRPLPLRLRARARAPVRHRADDHRRPGAAGGGRGRSRSPVDGGCGRGDR